ncbi:MAG TPA: 50S ribosomal protein L1 [Candidatus Peribacter riflensis]|uniref:Large ribosomal subunit protein uL1 n=1 Tax=Candidatus Peribacter riflensis TaxID=1735162 RepID=A0A0S1SVK3_9BACT|nr:MAG: ribosomal protein L1 (BL1) [Candidatus Peribacter riflensis]OGJ78977.1 MAG: 50S ribosomal protein L1 [Candidatus Peribacteria bacterium RIFOXYB1_FULL_57_12]ALM11120.1 MAG: ribosomal protein L1 (BL1) [Candidatus Peribacter riflensis]ALM12223.1 MAG: ribosomal protein L1 (BL1) [Candidatus Peribacter riflensis]ALM13325.1 MAG: ribosomal protein L1 (BL1) [Candidatus Peribacter riflensis]
MTSKRSPLARRHGKKYAERVALLTKSRYPLAEAMELLPKLSTVSFDATAEVHIRINADTTQADQLVRTTVALPHGTGRSVRVAAFVPDDRIAEAKKAGADLAGKEDLIAQIEKGVIDFDIAVAAPEVMKDLGKIAKTLGQKGLMPNPKSGTVTTNVAKTIAELKKGRIECKMDKQGIIHATFGKLSFGPEKLKENLEALLHAVKEAQPSGIKSDYIASVSVAPTMGPGMKLEL